MLKLGCCHGPMHCPAVLQPLEVKYLRLRFFMCWRRITGSADLFAGCYDSGLPGGLAAARRPCFGLNSISYLGKVQGVWLLIRRASLGILI